MLLTYFFLLSLLFFTAVWYLAVKRGEEEAIKMQEEEIELTELKQPFHGGSWTESVPKRRYVKRMADDENPQNESGVVCYQTAYGYHWFGTVAFHSWQSFLAFLHLILWSLISQFYFPKELLFLNNGVFSMGFCFGGDLNVKQEDGVSLKVPHCDSYNGESTPATVWNNLGVVFVLVWLITTALTVLYVQEWARCRKFFQVKKTFADCDLVYVEQRDDDANEFNLEGEEQHPMQDIMEDVGGDPFFSSTISLMRSFIL